MQVFCQHSKILSHVKEYSLDVNMALTNDAKSDHFEVKEKRSSDASLMKMNPVASGDNVATGLSSAHRLKEELPPLVPCCEGKELQAQRAIKRAMLGVSLRDGIKNEEICRRTIITDIARRITKLKFLSGHLSALLEAGKLSVFSWSQLENFNTPFGYQFNSRYASPTATAQIYYFHPSIQPLKIQEDLVHSGLSAISVKHDSAVVHCLSLSQASESFQIPPGTVKHRNSFRSLHRPDLKRVPYLRRMTAVELETLFKGYADIPTHPDRQDIVQVAKSPLHEQKINIAVTDKLTIDDGAASLHPIIENRSRAEDVPAGMRLHGARARLYTSVLAGDKPGDQAERSSLFDDLMHLAPTDDPLAEDEVLLHEELQIILPPRCDDVIAEPNSTETSSIAS